MFNINWPQLAAELTPSKYRSKMKFAAWLGVLLSPVRDLHTQFLSFRQDAIYKARFTGQIIYLEKRLNDRFDPIARGIYIDNVADVNWIYVFNSSEQQLPLYAYNNYNSSTTYQVGEYAQTATGVYQCTATSTGNFPDTATTFWTRVGDSLYLQNLSEYALQFDFIVKVPAALVFDANEMKAIINYYKLAGKRYTIQPY